MFRSFLDDVQKKILNAFSVRTIELVTMVKNLSILLEAGVPVAEAIGVLVEQTTGQFKVVLIGIQEDLNEGKTLADAFRAHPHIFPFLLISAVEIGEQSGTLSENLVSISEQMSKDLKIRQDISGALLYPLIILSAAVILMFGLATFVLPQLATVFSSLGTKLPTSTRILIWFADLFQKHGMVITPGFFLLLFLVIILCKQVFMRPVTHWVLLRIPFLGTFILDFNRARFCRSMGTMLESGVPIKEAMELTAHTVGNKYFQDALLRFSEEMEDGANVSDMISSQAFLYPSMIQHMVAVGERSGGLSQMFLYLAKFYEERVNVGAKNFSNILEPVLLLLMGVMVAFLAIAIFTPIYSMTNALTA